MTDWRTIRQLHSRRQRRPAQSLALAAALVLLALAMAACSGGSSDPVPPAEGQPTSDGPLSPPARPLRLEDVSFRLVGPIQSSLPIGIDIEEHPTSWFVVDVRNERLYAIEQATISTNGHGPAVRAVGWLPNDALFVTTGEANYRVTLDGEVFASGPLLVQPRDRDERLSAGGDWYARREGGSFGAILVGRTGEAPAYRLTNGWTEWIYWLPAWSPRGSRLAFTGNVCIGWDLFVFNPELGELQVLNDIGAGHQNLNDFAWHPNGASIAVNAFPIWLPPVPGAIRLIDVDTRVAQDVAVLETSGWLEPHGWSPSGDHLLIFYSGGGGFCEEAGLPGVPTPEATRLEVLQD